MFKYTSAPVSVSQTHIWSDTPSCVTTEPLYLRVTRVVLPVRKVQERGGVVVLNQLYEPPRYMGGAPSSGV